MTPLDAWKIISSELSDLMRYRSAIGNMVKPFTDEEIEAEVICFKALDEMQKKEKEKEKAEKGEKKKK